MGNSVGQITQFLQQINQEDWGQGGSCGFIRLKRHYLHFVLNKPNIKETRLRNSTEILTLVKIHTSKVQCCKEQYCIGTWNVRSMNQGKLEVVNQEMARVKVDILGISKLKWTGKGEFNTDDHYIYYCGQESLRRNGIAKEMFG